MRISKLLLIALALHTTASSYTQAKAEEKASSISVGEQIVIDSQDTAPSKQAHTTANNASDAREQRAKDSDTDNIQKDDDKDCLLYMAASSLPSVQGLGVFTTRPLAKGTLLADEIPHDPVIPMPRQNHNQIPILHDYTIPGRFVDREEHEAAAIAYGVTSLLNGDATQTRVNIVPLFAKHNQESHEHHHHYSYGASTQYHSMQYKVIEDIPAHAELLEYYGDEWFHKRPDYHHVPLSEDYQQAHELLRVWHRLEDSVSKELHRIMYSTMRNEASSLRLKNALPVTYEEGLRAAQEGPEYLTLEHQAKHIEKRQSEGIPPEGRCLQGGGIEIRESPQLYRGQAAYATRIFKEGDLLTGSPLLHIVNGTSLFQLSHQVWNSHTREYETVVSENQHQLLMNYCWGHAESTLLLCPYASVVGVMNHYQNTDSRINSKTETPNVGVRWAPDGHMNHRSSLLQESLTTLGELTHSGLALDYYALREIQPGEELVLDYGKSWLKSWEKHVRNWKDDKTARDFNMEGPMILRTQEEQEVNPYPLNIEMRCHPDLLSSYVPKKAEWYDPYGEPIQGLECDILERYVWNGRISYLVHVTYTESDTVRYLHISEVQRSFIRFADRPSEPLHHRDAFRHPMHLPDELFPTQWKDHV